MSALFLEQLVVEHFGEAHVSPGDRAADEIRDGAVRLGAHQVLGRLGQRSIGIGAGGDRSDDQTRRGRVWSSDRSPPAPMPIER